MSNQIASISFGEDIVLKALGIKEPNISVEKCGRGGPLWLFSNNGCQATGVSISVDMFDAMSKLVTNPAVVEHYEKLRSEK